MLTPAYINVLGVNLFNIRLSNFSNLPYSLFSTNTFPHLSKFKIKHKINKFKWRSNVVSLRAPKHFKVGRLHFNKSSRHYIIFFTNKVKEVKYLTKKINLKNTLDFFNVVNFKIQIPATVTKTYQITLKCKINFQKIA